MRVSEVGYRFTRAELAVLAQEAAGGPEPAEEWKEALEAAKDSLWADGIMLTTDEGPAVDATISKLLAFCRRASAWRIAGDNGWYRLALGRRMAVLIDADRDAEIYTPYQHSDDLMAALSQRLIGTRWTIEGPGATAKQGSGDEILTILRDALRERGC